MFCFLSVIPGLLVLWPLSAVNVMVFILLHALKETTNVMMADFKRMCYLFLSFPFTEKSTPTYTLTKNVEHL